MIKVFADNIITDRAIDRIMHAIKKYIPLEKMYFVDSEDVADLVIVYAFGQRKKVWWRVEKLQRSKKKYVVVQLCVRDTTNPNTKDWLPIWEGAILVWSYYNLKQLCEEDGNDSNFPFYYAPLGVDTKVFKETKLDKRYVIAMGTHRRESIRQILTAAKMVRKPVFSIGPKKDMGRYDVEFSNGMSDETLALYYSQCAYVSGLRRIEGFEMPVLEGLMCGARPICFDRPHYKDWFGDLAEYVPETTGINLTENLIFTFIRKYRPVTDEEKELVENKFKWETIIKRFWSYII